MDLAAGSRVAGLVAASTVPLNGLAAAQIVDLLGDAPSDGNRLLVIGAAGAVGGYVASLAQDRGLALVRAGGPSSASSQAPSRPRSAGALTGSSTQALTRLTRARVLSDGWRAIRRA